MYIPYGAIIPLYIASFFLLHPQYYRINPDRRICNLYFGLMVGAVALALATVFLRKWGLSPIFFLLGVFWLGLSFYLFRRTMKRPHTKRHGKH